MSTTNRHNIALKISLIPGGYTSTGEILYIGRKIHMGVMTPGKIHPSHYCLYVSYGGYEHSYKHNYEILVSRGPCEWIGEAKGIDFCSHFVVFFTKNKKNLFIFQNSVL